MSSSVEAVAVISQSICCLLSPIDAVVVIRQSNRRHQSKQSWRAVKEVAVNSQSSGRHQVVVISQPKKLLSSVNAVVSSVEAVVVTSRSSCRHQSKQSLSSVEAVIVSRGHQSFSVIVISRHQPKQLSSVSLSSCRHQLKQSSSSVEEIVVSPKAVVVII